MPRIRLPHITTTCSVAKNYLLTAMKLPQFSPGKRRLIFELAYAGKSWGDGGDEEFYSGTGSDEAELLAYSNVIKNFLSQKQIRTVVDIGCGDFRAARASLLEGGTHYIGIDIVPSLIVQNRRRYSNSQVEFLCLDAVLDELPNGDLCIIKQVLQHLSNAEIALILRKARKYKYVIITEHWPAPSPLFKPNKDMPPSADLRVPMQSGVYPHMPPFSYGDPKILLVAKPRQHYKLPGETITTMAFENS